MSADDPPRMAACRVVLVDTRNERRQLMRRVVEGDDGTALLVGEADNRPAALAIVDSEQADAVVLDVQMPVTEGLATIAALRERYPQLGIVVCSFDLAQATVERVLAEGADRCLAKPVTRKDVHAALADIRQHEPRPEGSRRSPVTATHRSTVAAS